MPRPRFEYKPRSLLADYKYLAILFVLLIAAGSVYLIRAPHKPLTIEPPPVYIEPVGSRLRKARPPLRIAAPWC